VSAWPMDCPGPESMGGRFPAWLHREAGVVKAVVNWEIWRGLDDERAADSLVNKGVDMTLIHCGAWRIHLRQSFEKLTWHSVEATSMDIWSRALTISRFTYRVAAESPGAYAGKQGFYDLAGKAMAITDGTFHEEVDAVLANDRYAVVLAGHRFKGDGASGDYTTAHVYEIREGKLAQCFEQPRDSASLHHAWGASQEWHSSVASSSRQPR
jgi:ketosteroid isomerase-like protein